MTTLAPLRFFKKLALSFGERFKIDIRYLAHGTFWGMVSQVASVGSALALSVVLSRYVSKDVYGEYKYILSLVSLLPILSLTGLGNAVLQSVSRGFDGTLAFAFRTNLRWSIAIFFGALAIALYYFLQGNYVIGIGVLIGGSLTPFIIGASLASAFLTAKKDFARLAIYGGAAGSFVPAAALIVTGFVLPNSLALVAVYFVSNVITDILLYWYVLRLYKPDPATADPAALTYAKHLSFMGIIGGIAANCDQILLFHFVGPAQLAIYSFATGIPDQLKGPLKNLDGMLQARFANHLPQNIRDNMGTKSLLLLAFSIVCIAVYVPLAPFVYHFLYPTYSEAIPYSQVYVLSFISLMFAPSGSYLGAKKLLKEQYISSISISILQIVCMGLGIIYFGLWGLIWAIIGIRIGTGVLWYVLYRIASGKEALQS